MTKKESNAAKARRQERAKTQRAQDMRKLDTSDLQDFVKKFGEGIKKKVQERQKLEISTRFSAPVEDKAAQSFSIPTPLSKPDRHVEHNDRIMWFWAIDGITVVASYVLEDTTWQIDVIGPNGSACFHMTASVAKAVGEATLSAVYWQHAWRDYHQKEQNLSGDGVLDAKVVPIHAEDE